MLRPEQPVGEQGLVHGAVLEAELRPLASSPQQAQQTQQTQTQQG